MKKKSHKETANLTFWNRCNWNYMNKSEMEISWQLTSISSRNKKFFTMIRFPLFTAYINGVLLRRLLNLMNANSKKFYHKWKKKLNKNTLIFSISVQLTSISGWFNKISTIFWHFFFAAQIRAVLWIFIKSIPKLYNQRNIIKLLKMNMITKW